ncbi:RDD family protein [Entomospira entomophila]
MKKESFTYTMIIVTRRLLAYLIDLYISGIVMLHVVNLVMKIFPTTAPILGSSLMAIFHIFISSMHIYCLKRTIGQRIFYLEFYQRENLPIRFWRNIVVHSLFITLFMSISFWYGVMKGNIFAMNNVTGLHVRSYQKVK